MTDENAMDGRYYGKDGKVWKAPVATKTETGQSISMGFPVCVMHEAVGAERAGTVAEMMNIGERAQWQPIETAPQDGKTKIILGAWSPDDASRNTVWVGALEPANTRQGDPTKAQAFWGLGAIFYPTHWMPLPEPPK